MNLEIELEDCKKQLDSLHTQIVMQESVQIEYKGVNKLNNSNSSENGTLTNYWKEKVICKICRINIKDVLLTNCKHMFCKSCIDSTHKDRNRKCPLCRENFGLNHFVHIIWE